MLFHQGWTARIRSDACSARVSSTSGDGLWHGPRRPLHSQSVRRAPVCCKSKHPSADIAQDLPIPAASQYVHRRWGIPGNTSCHISTPEIVMLMCGSDLLGSSVPSFVRAHQERQVPCRAAAREL